MIRNNKSGTPGTRFRIGLADPLSGGGLFGSKPMTRTERVKNATTKGKKASTIVGDMKYEGLPVMSPGQVRKARIAGKIADTPYKSLQGRYESEHRFGRRAKW